MDPQPQAPGSLSRSGNNDQDDGHRYRGHRRGSFVPLDNAETVELRARYRTDVAYFRTSLAMLSYSVVVLKVFDKRFYRIGLLYVVLACLLFICTVFRRRKSRHDFADSYQDEYGRYDGPERAQRTASSPPSGPPIDPRTGTMIVVTKGIRPQSRVFGRPFITAGWIVIIVSGIVAVIEIALFVLILKLS